MPVLFIRLGIMLAFLFTSLSTFLLPQAPGLPSETIIQEGKHFRIICHFPSKESAKQALAAVEESWKVGAKLFAMEETEVEEKLDVYLYRDASDYRLVDKELNDGAFERSLAFAHLESKSLHVAVHPPLSDAALEVVGLPAQTQRALAHVASHLVRQKWAPNADNHPHWFMEGTATWIDEQVSRELGLFKKLWEAPNYSKDILRVQALMKREEGFPTLENSFLDQAGETSVHEFYNYRWLFFHFMMESKYKQEFLEMIQLALQLPKEGDSAASYYTAIQALIPQERLRRIEQDFQKFVLDQKPSWDETSRSLNQDGKYWVQNSYDVGAKAWRTKPSGKKYTIEGEITIFEGEGKQMNLYLGRSDAGFFSVAFLANASVTMFEYEGGSWNRRASYSASFIPLGKPFKFRVKVDGDMVSVFVGGKSLGETRAQALDLSGPWGLGTQANTDGRWKIRKAPFFK